MSEKTIFDLRCIPCWCDHEKIGRNRHATSSDVIHAVENCVFAMDGLMIGCAHVESTAGFFSYDGRQILNFVMAKNGIDNLEIDRLYSLKWYLDILKRRACGRYFPMDPTVGEMRKSNTLKSFLHPRHPLRDLLLDIFHYAENAPKDEENIRICDLYFLNVDKYIADAIDVILKSVQRAVQEKS